MEKYSHGQFQVTGYVVKVSSPKEELSIINQAWTDFEKLQIESKITNKAYPTLHAIYYNYQNLDDMDNFSYDMLLGFITEGELQNTDGLLTTLTIPAQDYRFEVINSTKPEEIQKAWTKIIDTPHDELKRSYQYDLEMYNADFTNVTLAVSVNE